MKVFQDFYNNFSFSPLVAAEVDDSVGEYFIVTEQKKHKEHVIHFSKSIRGKPAIMGNLK